MLCDGPGRSSPWTIQSTRMIPLMSPWAQMMSSTLTSILRRGTSTTLALQTRTSKEPPPPAEVGPRGWSFPALVLLGFGVAFFSARLLHGSGTLFFLLVGVRRRDYLLPIDSASSTVCLLLPQFNCHDSRPRACLTPPPCPHALPVWSLVLWVIM